MSLNEGISLPLRIPLKPIQIDKIPYGSSGVLIFSEQSLQHYQSCAKYVHELHRLAAKQ